VVTVGVNMEEIEVLKSKALDTYLSEAKYTQVEDLLTACVVEISCSVANMMRLIYQIRGSGKAPDLKDIRSETQNVIRHVAIMAHCVNVEIPEFEEIEEFYEDELTIEVKMDAMMALMSIQYISSNMTMEYFSGLAEEDDMVDEDILEVGIVDMLANAYSVCNRFKLDYTNVIVYG
jgi:hypothetical protein